MEPDGARCKQLEQDGSGAKWMERDETRQHLLESNVPNQLYFTFIYSNKSEGPKQTQMDLNGPKRIENNQEQSTKGKLI